VHLGCSVSQLLKHLNADYCSSIRATILATVVSILSNLHLESQESTRTGGPLLDYTIARSLCRLLTPRVEMSSDTHVASYRDDCDIRNIGRQYAIVGCRYCWMHRGPYRMVPDGGMAIRNELWWRMVPTQTTTSVVSLLQCAATLHGADNRFTEKIY
jgi:hypothetical protein